MIHAKNQLPRVNFPDHSLRSQVTASIALTGDILYMIIAGWPGHESKAGEFNGEI
jgi:hypothetical protein